jgi:hypothetical protein
MESNMSEQNINWRTVEREEKGQLFADTFLDYINGSSTKDKEKAVEVMLHGHRTLQQQAFSFCIEYIQGLSDQLDSGYYDLRNQFSVETSRKIVDFLESENIGRVPLI